MHDIHAFLLFHLKLKQLCLDCRGVRAAGAANNLLQPTVARAAWSSYVLISGFVPSFSDLPASGRAMAAEQGR